jgi:hypothetical protein
VAIPSSNVRGLGIAPHPISRWGTPVGELFDLEMLSKLCKKDKQYTFFFTSAPLNYSGAVASPPNATAIL